MRVLLLVLLLFPASWLHAPDQGNQPWCQSYAARSLVQAQLLAYQLPSPDLPLVVGDLAEDSLKYYQTMGYIRNYEYVFRQPEQSGCDFILEQLERKQALLLDVSVPYGPLAVSDDFAVMHNIVVVGYVPMYGFKYINSWGETWGAEGYGFLPVWYVESYVWSATVVGVHEMPCYPLWAYMKGGR